MTTVVAVTSRDMYRAAVISQRVQNDFVTGLQVAKLNELKARMRREVVKFAYLKKSGEVRIAYGTLMPARSAPTSMWSVVNFDASKCKR